MEIQLKSVTPMEAILAVIAAFAIIFVVLAIYAWLLCLVLGWFGVKLSFWQGFAIIILVNFFLKSIGNKD